MEQQILGSVLIMQMTDAMVHVFITKLRLLPWKLREPMPLNWCWRRMPSPAIQHIFLNPLLSIEMHTYVG